ncbi:MAG: hypothetical protein A3I00_07930 [Betaproteobacteria bacterium RIFCSPLOWO2_02_FULL_64_12]|nr:MAG: hypothetical protein A3I00_07930 [Betaproteobacteria bacterium RIFCSPLOWO2_02_FULL_64_12]
MTALLLAGLVSLVGVPSVAAITIEVAQENTAGVGDFAVKGQIKAYDTALSANAFYNYGASSYNGDAGGIGGPAPVSSKSQIFFVNSAVDGLSLFVVHDARNDGTGGSATTRFNLAGDTASILVRDDDTGDDPNDTYADTGTQFDASHRWIACCTDGYVIGSLGGSWTMFGEFRGDDPTGLDEWRAVDGDHHFVLALILLHRIRLRQVPEPATSALLVAGAAGLVAAAWRTRRRNS